MKTAATKTKTKTTKQQTAWRASAPVRADLAGGTLDLWPLGLFHPGSVTLAVAVSLRVEATLTPRRGASIARSLDLDREAEVPQDGSAPRRSPLELLLRILAPAPRGWTLATRSPVRAGSGLGTSSALGVACEALVVRASQGRANADAIVAAVRDREAQVLGIPTGTQDHRAAWTGGIVALHHGPGAPRLQVTRGAALDALGERLLLVDSGEGRSSGPSNWDMFRRRIDGDREAVRALGRVASAGTAAAAALAAGDWNALGRAMRQDLDARAGWSPLVVTPALSAIFDAARAAGAAGWKVCGAGGGGYAAVLADPRRREQVVRAIEATGARVAGARPTARGLAVAKVATTKRARR